MSGFEIQNWKTFGFSEKQSGLKKSILILDAAIYFLIGMGVIILTGVLCFIFQPPLPSYDGSFISEIELAINPYLWVIRWYYISLLLSLITGNACLFWALLKKQLGGQWFFGIICVEILVFIKLFFS
jgi:hypothetical protein